MTNITNTKRRFFDPASDPETWGTVDGEEVWFARFDAPGEYPLVGVIFDSGGDPEVYEWSADGSFYADGDESGFDLCSPRSDTRVVRVYLYQFAGGTLAASLADPAKFEKASVKLVGSADIEVPT